MVTKYHFYIELEPLWLPQNCEAAFFILSEVEQSAMKKMGLQLTTEAKASQIHKLLLSYL